MNGLSQPRSVLFVPGDRIQLPEKAAGSGAALWVRIGHAAKEAAGAVRLDGATIDKPAYERAVALLARGKARDR